MKFNNVLIETNSNNNENKLLTCAFRRYNLEYKGTRENYKIHDKSPHILALDQKYNVDGHGESILGINLNYYDGDVKKLLKQVQSADNKNGYRAFDARVKFKEFTAKDKKKFDEWFKNKKIDRYEKLISQFPVLAQYLRRYKLNGITSQKREIFGFDDREPVPEED